MSEIALSDRADPSVTRSAGFARRRVVRIGLVALTVPNVVVGAWLLFAPRSFYDDFPGFGHRWVGALGPYSEHAFTDFGGALLALALLTSLAALWMERRLVQAALGAVLLQSLAHFVYHLTRLGALPTGDDIANQLSLAYGVVLSVVLLWLAATDDLTTRRRLANRRSDHPASRAGPTPP